MSWLYNNEPVQELAECVGFVYLITNKISNRRYIGKKLSHFTKTSIKTVTLKRKLKHKLNQIGGLIGVLQLNFKMM